jgi:hypothetical protein
MSFLALQEVTMSKREGRSNFGNNSIPLYKRWGSVAELTCHLQGTTAYGIRISHKTYRPSPTRNVTWKDPPLIRGPLTGGKTVYLSTIPANFGCLVDVIVTMSPRASKQQRYTVKSLKSERGPSPTKPFALRKPSLTGSGCTVAIHDVAREPLR